MKYTHGDFGGAMPLVKGEFQLLHIKPCKMDIYNHKQPSTSL